MNLYTMTMKDTDHLDNLFTYPVVTQEHQERLQELTKLFQKFAYDLAMILAHGREYHLMSNKLEEAMFYATMAICRDKKA